MVKKHVQSIIEKISNGETNQHVAGIGELSDQIILHVRSLNESNHYKKDYIQGIIVYVANKR